MLNKKLVKNLLNESGAGLAMAMISIVVLGAAGYYTLDYIDKMDENRRNLDLNLKARLVAEDAAEATKYLLFYERLAPYDQPQVIPNSWRSFSDTMTNTTAWRDVCGDMVASSDDTPSLQKDGIKVFCPVDLRDFRVSSDILEVQLRKYVDVFGAYKMEEKKPGLFEIGPFVYTTDQLSNSWFKFGLDEVTARRIKDIEVLVQVFTRDSGFSSVDSERYVKLISTVTYGMSEGDSGNLSLAYVDTFMLRTSSMKEFSLFLGYPTESTLKDSLDISKDSQFFGKVYFRGGFDFNDFSFSNPATTSLPVFNDLVIFGGSPTNIPAPTKENILKLRTKFHHGFVFGYDDYFIFDSDDVSNKTGGLHKDISLKTGGGGYDPYLTKTAFCDDGDPATDFVTVVLKEDGTSTCSMADIGRWGGPMVPVKGGGIEKIEAKGTQAFIMAATEELKIEKNGGHIYGVVFGGKVTGGKQVNFYGLPNLIKPDSDTSGLPGLTGADNNFSALVKQANTTYDLIGVPFLNMPMVIKGK